MQFKTVFRGCVLLAACAWAAAVLADVTLVDNGAAKATIVVAKNAIGIPTEPVADALWQPQPPAIKIAAAAKDLQVYIEKMTGAKLPIVADDGPAPAGNLILVGRSALTEDFDRRIPAGLTPTRDEEGFIVLTQGNRLLLAGNDEPYYHGTEYAVANFLNRQGVRWYMPGDFGDFVPKKASIVAGDINVTSKPDFKMRNWWGPMNGDLRAVEYRWKIRNGMNPILHFITLPADSSIRSVLPPAADANKPEMADIFGKNAVGRPNDGMPNLSGDASVKYAAEKIKDYFRKNPDVTSYGMGADDGVPVDFTPETLKRNLGFSDVGGRVGIVGELMITDEWMDWIQRVAQEVYKEFPDHVITTNGYANRNVPPMSITPDPKIWIMFAAIWSDTMHAYDNPRSWQTLRQGKMIEEWAKQYKNVYMYNYIYLMLAGCGAPVPLAHKYAHDMPLYKKWGVVGFSDEGRNVRTECGVFPPYLRARMMWDAGLDVKKETDEFFTNWYGPAKKPAMAFWEDLENTFETTPWLGHEDRILPYVYPADLLVRLEKDVREAEALATDDWSKPRVAADRAVLESLKAYLAMHRAEFDAKFAEAARQAQRMVDIRKATAAMSRFYFDPDPARNGDCISFYYWNSFQRNAYYQKVADATTGKTGEMIAVLPEKALCKLDPRDDGRYQGWFDPKFKADDWTAVQSTMPFYRQMPGAVDEQGYTYLGALWYRLDIDVPNAAKGKTVNLYCSAIEPEAWIWVNGKFVGHREFHECYERPNALDLDVTKALVPGRRNTVVIRVHTGLGAAAIPDALTSRLFLYSPKGKPISQL